MKNLFFFFTLLVAITACKNSASSDGKNDLPKAAQAETDTANFTTIEWADPIQNLGVLNFGEKVTINFHLKNTGTKPLFIISASPGCGCTVADFPKHAIAAGAVEEIVAEFDTNKGHPGHFNKAISVKANTQGSTIHNLTFEGEIKKEGEHKENKPASTVKDSLNN